MLARRGWHADDSRPNPHTLPIQPVVGFSYPVYARIGRKLVESLRNPTVVSNNLARRVFRVQPRSLKDAIHRALAYEDQEMAETRWSDAMSSGGQRPSWGGTRFGSRIVDSRAIEVPVPVSRAFAPIQRIGGRTGWYYGTWLWKLRGSLDLLCGGVGLRRGRRHPVELRTGDHVDFWRVEAYEPNKRLRFAAEMKVPGRAWLEFEVSEAGNGNSIIRQTAIFDPRGWSGLAYWYLLYPLHTIMFQKMLERIGQHAQSAEFADLSTESVKSDQAPEVSVTSAAVHESSVV